MDTFNVILKRSHFPENLSKESVREAYSHYSPQDWRIGISPKRCIIEKAMDEQFPQNHFTETGGSVRDEETGERWTLPNHDNSLEMVYAFAGKLEKDPEATQTLIYTKIPERVMVF